MPGLAQPMRGHVPVDGLVLPGLNKVGLVPDARATALADAEPVLTPYIEVRVVLVLGERLQVLERSPVLHDRGEAHVVCEQSLLRTRHEVVEHVLHPASAAKVHQAARELQLVVETSADEKDHEVPVDLDGHAPTGHFAHSYHPSVVRYQKACYPRAPGDPGGLSTRGTR